MKIIKITAIEDLFEYFEINAKKIDNTVDPIIVKERNEFLFNSISEYFDTILIWPRATKCATEIEAITNEYSVDKKINNLIKDLATNFCDYAHWYELHSLVLEDHKDWCDSGGNLFVYQFNNYNNLTSFIKENDLENNLDITIYSFL